MLVQDNQQVTSSWFVGMLEGEGSFRNTKKSNVEVRISNHDLDLILACEQYLKSNNIYFVRYEGKRLHSKIEYTISIRKSKNFIFDYPKILFDLIKDKMQCRKHEYETILGSSTTTCDPTPDLDWLIGIYEAEGSFSLIENCRGLVALKIDITNTNLNILQKVAKTLKELGCSWHVESKTRQVNWAYAEAINIYGMKRCIKFLRKTQNMWFSSRNLQRTNLMIEFIESRFSKEQKSPYSARELQIFQLMKALNKKRWLKI